MQLTEQMHYECMSGTCFPTIAKLQKNTVIMPISRALKVGHLAVHTSSEVRVITYG